MSGIHNNPDKQRYATHEQRFAILERDGYTCRYCGKKVTNNTANIDHIDPWRFGGRTMVGIGSTASCWRWKPTKEGNSPISQSRSSLRSSESRKATEAMLAARVRSQPAEAGVAQWQSSGFVNRRSRVQVPSLAPPIKYKTALSYAKYLGAVQFLLT